MWKSIILISVWLIVLIGGTILILIQDYSKPIRNFDYHIDLKEDSIQIRTNQNIDTTIHFDDLEEYIIKDNI